jgi:tripartite ATP-independent transporter DctM subunit
MSAMVLIIFMVLSLAGVPIAVSLGLAVSATLVYFHLPLIVIARMMYTSMNSFLLVAVPLFVLAGMVMDRGGVSERIFGAANSVVGRWRGGLGHVNILASMIFGGISGSSVADVGSLGPLEIKAMTDHGYPRAYAAAVTMVTSTLASIVPPSILMIIAAVAAEQSIGASLAGGFGPAVVLGVLFMGLNYVLSRRKNYGTKTKIGFSESVRSILGAIPALFSPIIILGGIFLGFVTPTEAAAIAVVYTLLIGAFVYRKFSWRELPRIIVRAGATTGTILLIAMTAAIATYIFTIDHLPEKVSMAILAFSTNPRVVILLLGLVFVIVGMFMDIIAAILILTPVIFPTAMSVGIEPIHFVVFMVTALSIGLSTPPVGVCLFATSLVSGLRIERIVRAAIPYYLLLLIFLMVVALIPNITLFPVRILM